MTTKIGRIVISGIIVILLSSCSGLQRYSAVPPNLTVHATIPEMNAVRYRIPADLENFVQDTIDSYWREVNYRKTENLQVQQLPPAAYLAISGGGDNGAFGAGLLNGWTEAGNRPAFKLVTGVSTGALTAPFAFLGSEYDEKLRNFYTSLSPDDIMEARTPIAAVTSDAMADNTPLQRLVEKEISGELLTAIAGEYRKGRLLLIATTDLDARQAVLWNMTKIASIGSEQSLELFRSILIASSAIPGAFPPVMVNVQANGQNYQEMHVDGGTTSQVFVYPPSLHVRDTSLSHHVNRERKVYIIRNARLDPDWAEVDRRTMSIASRAINTLIQSQGIGDLYRIYSIAQRDGLEYNLAFIPKDFQHTHREEFDTEYMRALFQTGFEMASRSYPWEKQPPGF